MKKLKKIWQENSVLFVLFFILIACVVALMIVIITYFVGGSKSKFGDRLEGIENYPFAEKEQKDIASKIKEDDTIKDVEIKTSGKTIYVTIEFDPKVTLVEAESKAVASLEAFDEDTLSFYDIEYLIKADSTDKTDGFQIIGAHNVSGTGGIVWNNNTKFETNDEK